MKYTNNHNISLLMSVWLAHDEYDMVPDTKKISATSLLKSVRQTILGSRINPSEATEDISGRIPSRLGSAIHGGIEKAWEDPKQAMRELGYPARVVDAVKMNPTHWTKADFPVWIELRVEKPCMDWIISGCVDAIINGEVHDIKSTGIFAYTSGSNNKKYQLQLSIYRWLNQEKVTSEQGFIEYYFKDWSKLEAGYKTNYPAFPVMLQPIPLLSVAETERFIRDKLVTLQQYWDKPEPELPLCDADDLWQGKPAWQYFGSPTAQKASKNFPTEVEAHQWRNAKGKGEVRYKAAKARACEYCPCSSNCSQYASLLSAGLI